MIFDLHADIGDDLFVYQDGKRLDNYHAPKLKKGNFSGVCMASFFVGKEDWQRMLDEVTFLRNSLDESKEFDLLLNADDVATEGLKALMSLEGMCGISEDVEEKIQVMHDLGIRMGSLTWNDENALATGAKGNPEHGLSELGERLIGKMNELKMIVDVSHAMGSLTWNDENALATGAKGNPEHGLSELGERLIGKMNELKMIVDVSHANEKTFWDIMKMNPRAVVATHSNAYALCDHYRNLKDEQLMEIKKRDGLVGMNAARYFVSRNSEEQTVLMLAKHARYIADLIGVEHVACGFDFMDFCEGGEDAIIEGLGNASQGNQYIAALHEVGFNDEEVKLICGGNFERFLKKYLD